MNEPDRELISTARLKLGNQYAYIEYLDADDDPSASSAVPIEQIMLSRRILEDPYAHIGGDGQFDAEPPIHKTAPDLESREQTKPPSQRRRENGDIEHVARKLQIDLWKRREELLGRSNVDPLDLLDPVLALRHIGFAVEDTSGLGQFRSGNQLVEVAGQIHGDKRLVQLSSQFPLAVRSFTAAHELGHATLGHSLQGLHRDRPLDGSASNKDFAEREADVFAAFFLMPAKLVRAHFDSRFGPAPFLLNDDTAFALNGAGLEKMRAQYQSVRALSLQLAKAESFGGRRFVSLARLFEVSNEAMAIRLEELRLIDF